MNEQELLERWYDTKQQISALEDKNVFERKSCEDVENIDGRKSKRKSKKKTKF
jgi:hypothetical protein